MRATNLTQLPNYSVVWCPASEHSVTVGIQDVVCELFHWSADALVWAEERVEQRGGGAVVLGVEAASVVLLGTFGTLPDQLRRELAACPQCGKQKPESADTP
jgi:hypothetical protein